MKENSVGEHQPNWMDCLIFSPVRYCRLLLSECFPFSNEQKINQGNWKKVKHLRLIDVTIDFAEFLDLDPNNPFVNFILF